LGHFKRWRTAMVITTRSAVGGRDFVIDQVNGGFMQHINGGLQQLASRAHLHKLRFTLPMPLEAVDEPTTMLDDEFALLQWKLALGSASAHLSRGLYFFAWPLGMTAILSPVGLLQKRCLANFKLDVEIFGELQADALDLPQKEKRMYLRHLCHQSATRTYMQACNELGFGPEPHAEIMAVAAQRITGCVTTTIDEEIVGIAKNFKEAKSCSRFRRPEVSFGRIITSGLLEKRFGFDFVSADVAPEARSERLDDHAFASSPKDWSLPFQTVQGAKQQADFYSPSAANMNVPAADLRAYRDAKALGSLALVADCYLGAMYKHEHLFAFEHVIPRTKEKVWAYPLKHMKDSAVLAVKMSLEKFTVAGKTHNYFDFKFEDEPFFVSIFEIPAANKACAIEPRSPAWQWQYAAMHKKPHAIRAFRDGEFEPIQNIAAKNACWLMCRGLVEQYAKHLKVHIPPGLNFTEVLTLFCMGVLGCSEEEALHYVYKRIALLAKATIHSHELLNVEEAIECMDRNDLDAMTQAQKHAVSTLEGHSVLIREYTDKKRAIDAKKGLPKKPAAQTLLPELITQAQVKKYMPPTVSCWRGTTRPEWWAHCKPNARILVPMSRFGGCEKSTIRDLIRQAWTQYNQREGKPATHCFFSGVFE
jgi:hypothetical protein